MIWQRARITLLTSVVLAAASVFARAENVIPAPAGGGPVASTPTDNPCAPATQSICVTEWVPQNFTKTVTVYKTVCEPQTFTAYKTVCVPKTCTRVCTVNKMVPVVKNVVRTVCVPTRCVETRTVMKKVTVCKPVTTYKCKRVDMGHYVCKQVPCRQGCLAKLRNRRNCCECCCVPMKTVRVWCPNKVWVKTPCTKMVRCTRCVPCPVQVTVCKMVPKQITCKVCCYQCVPQKVTQCYTTMVSKCVPYQCTRKVSKCVPCQKTITCCRMVPRTVVKKVPCCNPCCNTCCTPCCKKCRRSRHCCR